MIDNDRRPSLIGESPEWCSTAVSLNDLIGFNSTNNQGYGIGLNEIIKFPTEKEVRSNPKYYLRQRSSSPTSDRYSTYILVTRILDGEERRSWLNIGALFRQASRENKEKYYANTFMRVIGEKKDDYERVCMLFGISVIGDTLELSYGLVKKENEWVWGEREFLCIDEYINITAQIIKEDINHCLKVFGRGPEFNFCESLEYQDTDLCYNGIAISEMSVIEYNKENVLALIYDKNQKKQATGHVLYDPERYDPIMKVVLMDKHSGAISRIKEIHTQMNTYYFISKLTDWNYR